MQVPHLLEASQAYIYVHMHICTSVSKYVNVSSCRLCCGVWKSIWHLLLRRLLLSLLPLACLQHFYTALTWLFGIYELSVGWLFMRLLFYFAQLPLACYASCCLLHIFISFLLFVFFLLFYLHNFNASLCLRNSLSNIPRNVVASCCMFVFFIVAYLGFFLLLSLLFVILTSALLLICIQLTALTTLLNCLAVLWLQSCW